MSSISAILESPCLQAGEYVNTPGVRMHDAGTFFVTSSDGAREYFVDLETQRCDCPHYRIRLAPKMARVSAEPAAPLRCKHLKAAMWHVAELYVAGLKKTHHTP